MRLGSCCFGGLSEKGCCTELKSGLKNESVQFLKLEKNVLFPSEANSLYLTWTVNDE
jgi:hypothetical protein